MTESHERSLQLARAALQARDFSRAVVLLEQYLARSPGDVEATLELAVARLLDGDVAGFVALHRQVAPVLSVREPATGRLARLWRIHTSMITRAARTAAALSLAASPLVIAGCPGGDDAPDQGTEITAPAEVDGGGASATPVVTPSIEIPQLPPQPEPPPTGAPVEPGVSVGATTTEGSQGASSTPYPDLPPAMPPTSVPTPQTSSNPEPLPPATEQPLPPIDEVPPDATPPVAKQPPRPRPGSAHRYSGGVRPFPTPEDVFGGFATAGEIAALEEAARIQRARCDTLRREVNRTGSAQAQRDLRQCQATLGRMNQRLRALRSRRRR